MTFETKANIMLKSTVCFTIHTSKLIVREKG